jgi:VIT1/CCC1 family predicted Fe2+/Mn2+ transporter
MSKNEKSRQAQTNRDSTQQTNRDSITGTLSTAAGAILMLTAFSAIPDPVLQLVTVSIAGLLIGGAR